MGIKTQTSQVQICDICSRETGILESCLVCSREICHYCSAQLREGAYFNRNEVCKDCIEKPEVKAVEEAFRSIYWALTRREKEAFGKCKDVKLREENKEETN